LEDRDHNLGDEGMRDKQFILSEICRTAAHNDGKPLGIGRFRTETGIAQHEWSGIHWARWSDALSEAGFEPLEWNRALNEEQMIEAMARLVRKYNRFPVKTEILIEKRGNAQIPTPTSFFGKFGGRPGAIRRVRDYCSSREEYSDVVAILEQEAIDETGKNGFNEINTGAGKAASSGYIYLVKSGKLYKIGCSENHWRRKSELHKQTSEGIKEIHTISAIDDAPGIEKYWHNRFSEKRQRGEWFDLSAEDIRAFKKRKVM
jgi:hypothetical protein